MLTINWKQIYEFENKWILILYDISQKHYVGLPVYNEKQESSLFIKSINKYIVLDEITDYNHSSIKRCIYIKGKPLKISNKEFDEIMLKSKDSFLNYVKCNTDNTADGISYNKWCKNKLELMKKDNDCSNLKVGAICWVDLGYNIGNELRKLRPVILWRSSSNKKMWTAIPLTSKHKRDNYYFHYDLEAETLGTARIENLINISSSRIKEPYYIKNKIAKITKKDNDEILKIIKKYYAFEEISNKSLLNNSKVTSRNHVQKNREKVLT
jgi:mRNA-degrading endonuclease toxin of MazEF toxin-antitoxin module